MSKIETTAVIVVRCEFTVADAGTLVRALNHLAFHADNDGKSSYTIDAFCRKDCAARLCDLRDYIAAKLPPAVATT